MKSKRLKAHIVLGGIALTCGVFLVCAAIIWNASPSGGSRAFNVFAWAVFLAGGAWYGYARFMAWWRKWGDADNIVLAIVGRQL